MEGTLQREESFWQLHATERLRAALDVSLARQLMAAATLRGGLRTQDEARALLGRLLGHPCGEGDDLLLLALRQIYAQGLVRPYLLLPHNFHRFEDLKLRTSEASSNRWRRRWTRSEMSNGCHAV